MTRPRQYVSLKEGFFASEAAWLAAMERFGLTGCELYMDDVLPRDEALHLSADDRASLRRRGVKRLHASYWAWPTAFFTKNRYAELLSRMGGREAVAAYFGDETGAQIWQRWADEYALACELRADAFTFHLIDYAPIDGRWAFSQTRDEILQAMIYLIQHFLCELGERGLLHADAPHIELENAGWGLEYGAQTADDFKRVFAQLDDPFDRVRIGWDINHLLHAIGRDEAGQARFFLPTREISPAMATLERDLGGDPAAFAQAWIEHNLLDAALAPRVGSIHLSDCAPKRVNYFENGCFVSPYFEIQDALPDDEAREAYGVDVVLTHYDSHLPLGEGMLSPKGMRALVERLCRADPEFAILHELKNSVDQGAALALQLERLWNADEEVDA